MIIKTISLEEVWDYLCRDDFRRAPLDTPYIGSCADGQIAIEGFTNYEVSRLLEIKMPYIVQDLQQLLGH